MRESESYTIACFHCLAEYDAWAAIWCSHDPQNPTKVCPFCFQCFCEAPRDYIDRFWAGAPEGLKREREQFRRNRLPLGNLLIQCGLLTMEQVANGLAEQRNTGVRLGEALVQLGYLTPDELTYFLDLQNEQVPSPLTIQCVDTDALHKLGRTFCVTHRVVPLAIDRVGRRRFIKIATDHRVRPDTMEEIRQRLNAFPVPLLADTEAIEQVLKEIERQSQPTPTPSSVDARQWLGHLIKLALAWEAQEIHLEPVTNAVQTRLDVGGVFYPGPMLPAEAQADLISHIRRFAGMKARGDEGVERAYVDIELQRQRYRLQFFLMPGPRGPLMTIRIVYASQFLRTLDRLGMLPEQLDRLRRFLQVTQGLIIVSSPPRQGAVTTIYAILRWLSRAGRRIATVESPVRHPVADFYQLNLEPEQTVDLKAVLEHLRQRTPEVVYMESGSSPSIIQALLTMVHRSLCITDAHGMSVWDAVRGLAQAPAGADVLAHWPCLLIHQRLVRRLCPHCARPAILCPSDLETWGISGTDSVQIREAAGCGRCFGVGYRGRLAIFEVLEWNATLAQAWANDASVEELQTIAQQQGWSPLRDVALRRVTEGQTTLEELRRCALYPS